MIGVVRFFYLLALGLWVGEIVFFSFIAAPAIFGILGPARAGDVVGAIFPRYYMLGTAAAATALGCALLLARRAATSNSWSWAIVCLALGLAANAWAAGVVHPRAQRLRAALAAAGEMPAADAGFRRAHRMAVILNASALAAGLAGLGFSAAAFRQ